MIKQVKNFIGSLIYRLPIKIQIKYTKSQLIAICVFSSELKKSEIIACKMQILDYLGYDGEIPTSNGLCKYTTQLGYNMQLCKVAIHQKISRKKESYLSIFLDTIA